MAPQLPVAYSLDANGSMTSDGLRSFDYDESGRLAKVRILQGGEAARVSYLTNGFGQRVFKSEVTADQTLPDEETLGLDFIAWLKNKFRWMFDNAQSTASLGTSYFYAEGLPSWALLGEYDNGSASGTGRTEYVWLPMPDGSAIPLVMRTNGRFYSIHTDHLGTPRMVKDDTNTTVWQWPYSAFGNNRPVGVLSSTSTTGYTVTAGATPLKATAPAQTLNLRYPGQYADSETGEFYNYFRQYDPRTGRYTQGDPIGLGGGSNRYGYAGGNPLAYSDAKGLATLGDIALGNSLIRGFAPELYTVPSSTISMTPNLSTWYGGQLQGYTDINNNIQMNAGQYGDSKTMVPDEVVPDFLQTLAHERSHGTTSTIEKLMTHGPLHSQIDSNASIVSSNIWKEFINRRNQACH